MARKSVVITGVSSGIGSSLLDKLSQSEDILIIGTVRNQHDAERITSRHGPNVKVILMDIASAADIERATGEILSMSPKVDCIINNAGIAVSGPILHIPMDDVRHQFEVNVFGLLDFTQRLFPAIKQASGRIINIGSISGLVTSPFVGAYSASKHAVEALNDALRRELLTEQVKVILIQPGPIKTAIWDKARGLEVAFADTQYAEVLKKADRILDNTIQSAFGPERVTRAIEKAMFSKSPKTRYLIHRRPLLFPLVAHLLPDKWLDALIKRNLFSGEKFRPL